MGGAPGSPAHTPCAASGFAFSQAARPTRGSGACACARPSATSPSSGAGSPRGASAPAASTRGTTCAGTCCSSGRAPRTPSTDRRTLPLRVTWGITLSPQPPPLCSSRPPHSSTRLHHDFTLSRAHSLLGLAGSLRRGGRDSRPRTRGGAAVRERARTQDLRRRHHHRLAWRVPAAVLGRAGRRGGRRRVRRPLLAARRALAHALRAVPAR